MRYARPAGPMNRHRSGGGRFVRSKPCRPLPLLMVGLLAGVTGCSTFREIPRADYASRPEYRVVQVVTKDGSRYEFDSARVAGDTLTGMRRRDDPGPLDEYDAVALPMENVATLRARRIDWFRTALVGGLAVGAVVAVGLAARSSSGGTSDGGGGPCRNCLPQR
jgi:hypothetical protein